MCDGAVKGGLRRSLGRLNQFNDDPFSHLNHYAFNRREKCIDCEATDYTIRENWSFESQVKLYQLLSVHFGLYPSCRTKVTLVKLRFIQFS